MWVSRRSVSPSVRSRVPTKAGHPTEEVGVPGWFVSRSAPRSHLRRSAPSRDGAGAGLAHAGNPSMESDLRKGYRGGARCSSNPGVPEWLRGVRSSAEGSGLKAINNTLQDNISEGANQLNGSCLSSASTHCAKPLELSRNSHAKTGGIRSSSISCLR